MKAIKTKLKPGTIYLTDGSLQRISWLSKEWETIYLWCPTTKEILSAIEEYTDDYRSIIISVKNLKTCKEDSIYGLPLYDLYINPLSYVFISLDSSPELFELDKDSSKKLKSKLEINVNGLNYNRLTLNTKSYCLTEDTTISTLLIDLDNNLSKKILSVYSDYPYDLVKMLKSPELFEDPDEDKDDEVISLVNLLGSYDGVIKWSNLGNQELMSTFIVKTLVGEVYVPYIVKSICSVGKTIKLVNYYKDVDLPSPYNQDLYLYIKPILDKISSLSVDRAKLYLGFFARFAFAVTKKSTSPWYCGFKQQRSAKGLVYLCSRLSKSSINLWFRFIVGLKL